MRKSKTFREIKLQSCARHPWVNKGSDKYCFSSSKWASLISGLTLDQICLQTRGFLIPPCFEAKVSSAAAQTEATITAGAAVSEFGSSLREVTQWRQKKHQQKRLHAACWSERHVTTGTSESPGQPGEINKAASFLCSLLCCLIWFCSDQLCPASCPLKLHPHAGGH